MPLAKFFNRMSQWGAKFKVAELSHSKESKAGGKPARELKVEIQLPTRANHDVIAGYLGELGGKHGFRVIHYLPESRPAGRLPTIEELFKASPRPPMLLATLYAVKEKANEVLEKGHAQILEIQQAETKTD